MAVKVNVSTSQRFENSMRDKNHLYQVGAGECQRTSQEPLVSINVGTIHKVTLKVTTAVEPVLGSCVRVCFCLKPPGWKPNDTELGMIMNTIVANCEYLFQLGDY